MEKVDEHGFLFGVEVSADRQHLAVGAVGVERDLLRSFCQLEATRVMLGLWGFCGQGLEIRGKLGGVLDSFSMLTVLKYQI